ncbi:MAG TPA: PPK2 family polyphosphate kinase [Mycobacteriales bacterium]|nr:PPK2 family polyphosphate kinase [Mycobacteriales bacterium]
MAVKQSVRTMLAVAPGGTSATPVGMDPRDERGIVRKTAEKETPVIAARLRELQERLFAESSRSVLLVLQGMDTSGKGGTIEHVIGDVNPMGVQIKAFKKPTPAELSHHYLWRVRRELPTAGRIGIFDRSHYEDVLIVRVHNIVPREVWSTRYDEINRFEAKVAAAGTVIVKCFLHISYDEQRERLLARLADPEKRWKFREGDIDERAHWADYQEAYHDALTRCSTEVAPWYVVPADRKWLRNHLIARLLLETLEEMDPKFPDPPLDLLALRRRLEPPG